MADLIFTRSGELMVTQIEGDTDAGIDFVDAWMQSDDLIVVDVGRIIVPSSSTEAIVEAADSALLTIEHAEALV